MSNIHPENPATTGETADRGIPQLAKKRANNKWLAVGITGVALVVVLAIGAHIGLKKLTEARSSSGKPEQKSELAPALPDMTRGAFDRASQPPPLPPADSQANTAPAAKQQSTLSPNGQPQLSPEEKAAKDLAERRKRAPILVSGSMGDGGSTTSSSVDPAGGDVDHADTTPSSRSSLGDAMTATRTKAAGATRLANPSLTIAMGQTLDCNLVTAINSDQPGMTSCVLARDVYSTNGRVLLLERGSRIIGQYQSAQLKQGQKRIFLLWTRIQTPGGVLVNLDSPSIDPVGRSGVDGHIDLHFMERFGAAFLMSFVDDLSSYAQNQASQSNGGIQFTNTAQSGQTAAAIIVQNTANIPPTLDKAQGSRVGVFVARDLSLENVYALRATR